MAAIWTARPLELAEAYMAHPRRFLKGLPQPPALSEAMWLNPPDSAEKGGQPATIYTRLVNRVSGTD